MKLFMALGIGFLLTLTGCGGGVCTTGDLCCECDVSASNCKSGMSCNLFGGKDQYGVTNYLGFRCSTSSTKTCPN